MDQFDLLKFGAQLGMYFVPFLFALCFHEFAHGVVAKMRGDNTAELAGRLSLNPFVHADPIGTWVLPILAILFSSPFFFGWAKPVPVNSRNLKHPQKDMFWIAIAGPLSNLFLALVSTVILGLVFAYMRGPGVGGALTELLKTFILINMFLAIFNLIPIHPLDGGKVIAPFLPREWNNCLEENQSTLNMFLLIAIFMGGRLISIPVHFAWLQLMGVSTAIAQYLI